MDWLTTKTVYSSHPGISLLPHVGNSLWWCTPESTFLPHTWWIVWVENSMLEMVFLQDFETITPWSFNFIWLSGSPQPIWFLILCMLPVFPFWKFVGFSLWLNCSEILQVYMPWHGSVFIQCADQSGNLYT